MFRTLMIAAASAAVLALSPTAFAQQTGGTVDEIKAMLMKAVAAVNADKAEDRPLDMFNKGEGGFLDRDLYSVFCENVSDGKAVAALATQIVSKSLVWTSGPSRISHRQTLWAELYAAYQKPER